MALTWLLIAIFILIIFLTLAILGTMREVLNLRNDVVALTQLITLPPTPEWVNSKSLPMALVRALREYGAIRGTRVLVFLESQCPTCRNLISDLDRLDNSRELSKHVLFVVMDKPADNRDSFSSVIGQEIERLGYNFILDLENELMHAAGVHGTPTAFR